MDLELFPGGMTPSSGLEPGLDAKILSLYGHLQADRMTDVETALLGMIGTYPDNAAFANVLPGLLATSIPKILGEGSSHFTYADGHPLTFGYAYTPPEYTMVYLELILHKSLLGQPAIPTTSAVYQTIAAMWDILVDIIPASRRSDAVARFEAYAPLPPNVVRFRPKSTLRTN